MFVNTFAYISPAPGKIEVQMIFQNRGQFGLLPSATSPGKIEGWLICHI